MKLLVVGDLHGNKPKIHFRDFDAIIAPGDFCSDAPRRYMFMALKEHMLNLDSKIQWYDYVGKKKATKMLKKSIKDGRKILKFLNSFGVPVYAVPGNWEPTGFSRSKLSFEKRNMWGKMISDLKNIKDLHFKRKSIDGFDIIGYGVVSGHEYPQYKEERDRLKPKELAKRKKDYKKKKERLSKLFKISKQPIIFMPHNVPYNTTLDIITNKESPRCGYHYGSVIARDLVEKYQPLLCIGGHMHEHFGKQRIGKTVCINAGFGSKVNTLIDLDEEKGSIRSIKFHPRPYG